MSSTDSADEVVIPARKRTRKSHFSVQMKEFILNSFKKEIEENQTATVDEVVLKVSNKVGVCRASIYNVIREYKNKHTLSEPMTNKNRKTVIKSLHEADKYAIKRKVYEFFIRNEIPTIDKLLKEVNEDAMLPDFKRSTFHKLLKHLNFKWEKRGRYSLLLLDKEEIELWSNEYPTEIKSYRDQNRNTDDYFDETYLDFKHTPLDKRIDDIHGDSNETVISSRIPFLDGLFSGLETSAERLIIEVRNQPCLWNKNLEEYRTQNVREIVWENISKKLGKPVDVLKTDWKKLQDCYRQAMGRRKTKHEQSGKALKPWKYEEQMSFLTSCPQDTQSSVNNADASDENEGRSSETKFFEMWSAPTAEENTQDESHSELENTLYTTDKHCQNKKIPKRNFKNDDTFDKIISFLQSRNKNKQKIGELDYFFRSVCESTKRLPRHLQLRVKGEVMKALLAAETEALNKDHRPSTSHTDLALHNHASVSPAISPNHDEKTEYPK